MMRKVTIQNRIDKVNKRLMEQRKRLLNPSIQVMKRQIMFSVSLGVVILTSGVFTIIRYENIWSAGICITGMLMLINACILKVKIIRS